MLAHILGLNAFQCLGLVGESPLVNNCFLITFCPHSEHTKCALMSSAYVHLHCKNYFKFTKDISSLSQRVLLSGPTGIYMCKRVLYWSFIWSSLCFLLSGITYIFTGTEIYQEYLVKALAKYFGARLLTVDSSMLFGVRSWTFTYIFFSVFYLW